MVRLVEEEIGGILSWEELARGPGATTRPGRSQSRSTAPAGSSRIVRVVPVKTLRPSGAGIKSWCPTNREKQVTDRLDLESLSATRLQPFQLATVKRSPRAEARTWTAAFGALVKRMRFGLG